MDNQNYTNYDQSVGTCKACGRNFYATDLINGEICPECAVQIIDAQKKQKSAFSRLFYTYIRFLFIKVSVGSILIFMGIYSIFFFPMFIFGNIISSEYFFVAASFGGFIISIIASVIITKKIKK